MMDNKTITKLFGAPPVTCDTCSRHVLECQCSRFAANIWPKDGIGQTQGNLAYSLTGFQNAAAQLSASAGTFKS